MQLCGYAPARKALLVNPLLRSGIKTKIKSIPKDWCELREYLGRAFPCLPEDLPPLPDEARDEVLESALAQALCSLEDGPPNHDAFAEVLAAALEPGYAVEREDKENVVIQWFCSKRSRVIRGGGQRRILNRIRPILSRVALPIGPKGQKLPAPSLYGNSGFLTPVAHLVRNRIPLAEELPPIDGVQSAGLLLGSDGWLIDFRTAEVRRGQASDRISWYLNCLWECY